MALHGYVWLFMVIYGCLWLFMVIYGYLWLCMVIYGCLLGYLVLVMATYRANYGYQWLRFIRIMMNVDKPNILPPVRFHQADVWGPITQATANEELF